MMSTPIDSFPSSSSSSTSDLSPSSSSSSFSFSRLPTLFISHGGGPCFFMDTRGSPSMFSAIDKHSAPAAWYRQLATQMGLIEGGRYGKPKAILLISAHWETKNNQISVTSQEKHSGLLYDYYGFPDYTYSIDYPAPGSPSLASRVIDLLKAKKIDAVADTKRNFDHGVFIPLKLIYPNADIPIVEVSINSNLDPSFHIQMGEALAPLRDEGVFIIGSGQATHDLSFQATNAQAEKFIDGLNAVLTNNKLSSIERINQLSKWTQFPYARICHPREEHLIPFFPVIGAAKGAIGKPLQKKHFLVEGMSLQSWAFEYQE